MYTKCIINKSAGLTLMELMVVIAIIGITSGMSIPYFARSEHKVKKVAMELMGDMQKTRMNAIKTNQKWQIKFDTVNDEYVIEDGNNVEKKVVVFSNYSAGVKYGPGSATTPIGTSFGDGVTYNSNTLSFNSRGVCSMSTSGYGNRFVYIEYGDVSYAVGTNAIGNVKLRRWTGGAWK